MARGNNSREQAKKRYAYEAYEDREGAKKLRSISQKKYAEGDLPDNLIFSSKKLKELESIQERLEDRNIDYKDTVDWGTMGGRPKKWASNTERMRYTRALQKWNAGKTLNSLSNQEIELLDREKRRSLGRFKSRPGAYRSGLGRPLTPAEKMRILRARRNKS